MDLDAHQRALAKMIDGVVADESDRVEICVKGTVNGFPAQLEAFTPSWPFNVTYIVQTNIVEAPEHHPVEQAKISIMPRIGQGFLSFFSHIFLFEAKGMNVNDKRLEKKLIFNYDNRDAAMRVIRYPGVPDILITLAEDCRLKELVIKTDGGLYMVQGSTFEQLDLDLCLATFNYMGQIAQVLSDLY